MEVVTRSALDSPLLQRIRAALHAVETLGSVTVLASDKTGTLTEGRMSVRQAATDESTYAISGVGYSPTGG